MILKAEGVSKQYRLGLIGTGTLSHDLNRWWHRIRGKEDPYLKIGESNDRSTKGESQYVWALKDINFKVKRGEVLGIIGKNGAGKSTLLKILSRVTLPTTGEIKTKGRIASLLEVGTGFHPEMTGRENIFLNGAILGMTKKEIATKIDEIIEFSGCERYIDTPVKRYSSGMRVRLAFAVAAHLEPDILVVDEVLAVGDAEFQKKAIGKMQDISQGEGRTVLFVSHNMAAIKSLCTRLMVLNNGELYYEGEVNEGINKYLKVDSLANKSSFKVFSENELESAEVQIELIGIKAKNKDFTEPILKSDEIELEIEFLKKNKGTQLDVTYQIKDEKGNYLMTLSTINSENTESNKGYLGKINKKVSIPSLMFSSHEFSINLLIVLNKKTLTVNVKDLLHFQVIDDKKELGDWMGKSVSPLTPFFKWKNN